VRSEDRGHNPRSLQTKTHLYKQNLHIRHTKEIVQALSFTLKPIQYQDRHIVFKARRSTLTDERVLNVCFNEIGKVTKDRNRLSTVCKRSSLSSWISPRVLNEVISTFYRLLRMSSHSRNHSSSIQAHLAEYVI
jgi:hypothetical protein